MGGPLKRLVGGSGAVIFPMFFVLGAVEEAAPKKEDFSLLTMSKHSLGLIDKVRRVLCASFPGDSEHFIQHLSAGSAI